MHLGNRGVVRDITLLNASISAGNGLRVGALVGYNEGLVDHGRASGHISSGARVGGLVGENSFYATIFQSSADIEITGSQRRALTAGGLVGYNRGIISQSYAAGSLTAPAWGSCLGGLVGIQLLVRSCHVISRDRRCRWWRRSLRRRSGWTWIERFIIELSYATGGVVVGSALSPSGPSAAGGLVGVQQGTLQSSFATGKVTGGSRADVGGLFGRMFAFQGYFAGSADTSYATGAVTGGTGARVGSVAGHIARGKLNRTYGAGLVVGESKANWGV